MYMYIFLHVAKLNTCVQQYTLYTTVHVHEHYYTLLHTTIICLMYVYIMPTCICIATRWYILMQSYCYEITNELRLESDDLVVCSLWVVLPGGQDEPWLPGRPGVGAAGAPRPWAERKLPRSLPRRPGRSLQDQYLDFLVDLSTVSTLTSRSVSQRYMYIYIVHESFRGCFCPLPFRPRLHPLMLLVLAID